MTRERLTARTLAAWDRQDQAAKLRREGFNYREIASELGYAGPEGAVQAVRASMQRAAGEASDDLRLVELERYDELMRELWDVIHNPPPMLTKDGTPAADGDGSVILDATVKINAAGVMVRLYERRAKLAGLDAPQRRTVEVVTNEIVAELAYQHRREIEKLEDEARALGIPEDRWRMAAIDVEASSTVDALVPIEDAQVIPLTPEGPGE